MKWTPLVRTSLRRGLWKHNTNVNSFLEKYFYSLPSQKRLLCSHNCSGKDKSKSTVCPRVQTLFFIIGVPSGNWVGGAGTSLNTRKSRMFFISQGQSSILQNGALFMGNSEGAITASHKNTPISTAQTLEDKLQNNRAVLQSWRTLELNKQIFFHFSSKQTKID